jgi:hypothetical protein
MKASPLAFFRGAAALIAPATAVSPPTNPPITSYLGKKDTSDGAVGGLRDRLCRPSTAGDHAALGDALRDGRLATS